MSPRRYWLVGLASLALIQAGCDRAQQRGAGQGALAALQFLGQPVARSSSPMSGWQQAVGPSPRLRPGGGGLWSGGGAPAGNQGSPSLLGGAAGSGASGGFRGGFGGSSSGRTFQVKASSFGNQTTASANQANPDNYLSPGERGVALPHGDPVRQDRWVKVTRLKTGQVAYAPVVDVGPWGSRDPYWEGSGTPEAALSKGTKRRGTLDGNSASQVLTVNGAGIDLSWETAKDLGFASPKNVSEDVSWSFVDPSEGQQWVAYREGRGSTFSRIA